MNGWLTDALAGVGVGLLLGVAYFGGLMATTRRLTRRGGSPLLLAISLVGRLALLGGSLVLLARWSPVALVAATGALVAVRVAMTRGAAFDRWFGIAAPAPGSVRSDHG